MTVRYEIRSGVAVLTVDNPPVNAISAGVRDGIIDGVKRAVSDAEARAAVLIGAGSTFIAGADIKVFATIADREASLARSREVHAGLRFLEDCGKPVVAAIHGSAFGGGLEFAMACHYRIAVRGARVGQPEVQLGLIPGAGGTQRLPRLAGLLLAIEMCTDGAPVGVEAALRAGIIDEVVDGDLLAAAIEFALSRPAPRRTRELPLANDRAAVATARAALAKRARGARAPFAALEAIEAGAELGFEAGSEREMELFAECVLSRQSQHMIRLFFAEREAARLPGVSKDSVSPEVKMAAVVGAGTMGGGIAMAYANAGIPVLLQDSGREALDRGMAAIRRNYEASAARGKVSREQVESAISRIRPVTGYEGFEAADIVVEAVFEELAVKRNVFAELGRVTRPGCLLVSNTSTLDIDQLAEASGRPEQVAGHHFFSPANVMKLLEIVRGRATSQETLLASLRLAKRLGKVGVVVGNCFGFVANRMLAYYLREAHLMLEEGAPVAQIDGVMTRFGMPVGPFAMQDIAGIDVGARIRRHLESLGMTRAEGPQSVVPDRLFEMGRYGQKTGSGWYRYEPGSRTPVVDPMIDELASEAAAARGVVRRAVGDDEILSRILVALANEGANILEEGIAARAGDIDLIYAYGFGFPRHEGGPMGWADSVGVEEVLSRVRRYREQFGGYWRPSALLERLAGGGRTARRAFSAWDGSKP